jgi:methylenetetrahydrofolate--tRNA-(uracil-5-)-methyltransferase
MNVNFGLFPPLDAAPSHGADGKKLRGPDKAHAKKRAICARALADLDHWIADKTYPIAAE